MVFKNVEAPVARVEQSTEFFCGAACSVMALNFFKRPLLQEEAYSVIRENNSEPDSFYSDPDGISACLNEVIGGNDPIPFPIDDYSGADAQGAMDRIFYNLNVLSLPSLCLVYSGNHWVVIDGIRIEETASGSRSFVGVQVVDPFMGEPQRRFVPGMVFRERYLTGNTFGHKWRGKIVVISDIEASGGGGGGLLKMVLSSTTRLNFLPVRSAIGGGGGGGADYHAEALTQLAKNGFSNITRPRGGGIRQTVVSVKNLSQGEHDYKLVLLDAKNNPDFNGFVWAAIEENTNQLLEVTSDIANVRLLPQEEANKLLQQQFPNKQIVTDAEFCWKLSPVSRSHFNLARRFTVDGNVKFLLTTGRIVDDLPTYQRGGM